MEFRLKGHAALDLAAIMFYNESTILCDACLLEIVMFAVIPNWSSSKKRISK